MKRVPVEVVIVGYHDHRISRPVPFAFVVKAAGRISVHQRSDLTRYNLPEMFAFTAKNLGTVIISSTRNYDQSKEGLHEFLIRTCFNTVGSFRCWQPIEDRIAIGDLDGYVGKWKESVNKELADYERELKVYDESCSPNWKRWPDLETPHLPSVCPAF